MTNDMIKKAMECKSAEEILALAKENGIEMTQEEAEVQFAQLHAEGELSDDELDGASGGASTNVGTHEYKIVTSCHSCDNYAKGYQKWNGKLIFTSRSHPVKREIWHSFSHDGQCGRCVHLQFKGCRGICDIPLK